MGGERWGQGQKKLEMGFGDLVEISMVLNPSLIGLMELNDPQLDHKAEGAHGQIFEFATTLKSISKQPNQSVHSEKNSPSQCQEFEASCWGVESKWNPNQY